jgi:hypothetical protein
VAFFTQETFDEGRAEIARGEYLTACAATGDAAIFPL